MICAICDESDSERKKLAAYLRRFEHEQSLEISINEYKNTEGLMADFSGGKAADILFLDIYINGISGMEAAKSLYENGFSGSFVFCTTSREHAIESYDIDADGYMLKPYSYSQFAHTMERCRSRWEKNLKRISFLSRRLEFTVLLRDIRWIETRGKGCLVHVKEDALESGTSIGRFTELLCSEDAFFRMGKSYIINLNFIRTYDGEFVYMKSGERIAMPVRDRSRIKKEINNFCFLQISYN